MTFTKHKRVDNGTELGNYVKAIHAYNIMDRIRS